MNPSKTPAEILNIAGTEVRISSPDKVVFPEPGLTKLDLVRYYLAVADGALRGAGGRPMVLKRFPKGIDAEPFFQKRVPDPADRWRPSTRGKSPTRARTSAVEGKGVPGRVELGGLRSIK